LEKTGAFCKPIASNQNIENFSFIASVIDLTFTFNYICEFYKIFETAPTGYSGPRGKVICAKKTEAKKPRVRLPLSLKIAAAY
jgi:hypothetical protein